MKNLFIILTIGLLCVTKCFAVEVTIDNPYKDIAIHVLTNHQNKDEKVCKKNKKKCKSFLLSTTGVETVYKLEGDHRAKNLDIAKSVDFSIFLKGNKQTLPEKSYNVIGHIKPSGNEFKEDFILDGKKGRIVYKAEAKFRDNVIKSLKIKVVKATLEGEEFDK